jgi:hypothetical protein
MRHKINASPANPFDRLGAQFIAGQREHDVALYQGLDHPFAGGGEDSCAGREADGLNCVAEHREVILRARLQPHVVHRQDGRTAIRHGEDTGRRVQCRDVAGEVGTVENYLVAPREIADLLARHGGHRDETRQELDLAGVERRGARVREARGDVAVVYRGVAKLEMASAPGACNCDRLRGTACVINIRPDVEQTARTYGDIGRTPTSISERVGQQVSPDC